MKEGGYRLLLGSLAASGFGGVVIRRGEERKMLVKRLTICAVVLFALALSGCDIFPTATPTAELGSAERPIQVYFVPSVEADTIVTGGAVLEEALEEATSPSNPNSPRAVSASGIGP